MRKSLKGVLRTAWDYSFGDQVKFFREHAVSILATALVLTPAIYEVDKWMNTTKGYRAFPPAERAILKEYDTDSSGLQIQELRLLLNDYDLVRRETPKEIPEVPYAH